MLHILFRLNDIKMYKKELIFWGYGPIMSEIFSYADITYAVFSALLFAELQNHIFHHR